MSADDWVSTALADDRVVIELLLRMKQSTATTPSLPPPPTLSWVRRRARSKPASSIAKKDLDLMMRCSPTTPLSWSCSAAASSASASPSDGSCQPSDQSFVGRSKGAYTNDSIACSSANKHSNSKSRKEGGNPLQKKRFNLENESETVHVTLKKQKVERENFKRLKNDRHQGVASESYYAEDLCSPPAKGVVEASRIDYGGALNNIQMNEDHNSFKAEKGFILPDLNMLPSEDDFLLRV